LLFQSTAAQQFFFQLSLFAAHTGRDTDKEPDGAGHAESAMVLSPEGAAVVSAKPAMHEEAKRMYA